MSIKKSIALVLVLILTVASCGMSAFALSDIDFTLAVDTTLEYVSEMEVEVPIQIKTQTDNGFVDLEMFLIFDEDILTCATIVQDQEGFTTRVETRESDGQTGLVIIYSSPDGNKTGKDTVITFTVKFSVKTDVASTNQCTLSLEVLPENVYGFDSYGNKENEMHTLSAAKEKNLTIMETHQNKVTTGVVSSGDPNYFFTTPSVNQSVEDKGDSCGSTVGKTIGLIFGALVVFAAGVVVGFVMCQKRMNEDGYNVGSIGFGSFGGFGGFGKNHSVSDRDEDLDAARESYSRYTGRSPSIYDEDDFYTERVNNNTRPSARPSTRPPVLDDDELVDTSYFGRASDARLGSSESYANNSFDDDDDDEGFPEEFSPRKGADEEDAFSSFFGGASRRDRNDDGYGSFGGGFEDDDNDYRSDRRRYR